MTKISKGIVGCGLLPLALCALAWTFGADPSGREDDAADPNASLEALYQMFRADLVRQGQAGRGTLLMPDQIHDLRESVLTNLRFWHHKVIDDFGIARWVLAESSLAPEATRRIKDALASPASQPSDVDAMFQQVWLDILSDAEPATQPASGAAGPHGTASAPASRRASG